MLNRQIKLAENLPSPQPSPGGRGSVLSPRPSGEGLGVRERGFTLVEMIIVIVITGIIGGIVAMFIKAPVQGYVDSARRAELTDIADTAVRRMARDIRTAVPNSVRVTGTSVEFIPTKDGGRYRASTPGDTLDFNLSDGTVVADPSFDIVGSFINFVAGDYIVVGSTQSDGSLPYDVTVNGVLRAYSGYVHPKVSITNAVGLPSTAQLDTQRFDVVDGTQKAVTYACVGGGVVNGDGAGDLVRYANYGFSGAPTTVTPAILASKVDCTKTSIEYDVANQRFGLVSVRLTLTSSNESVSLYNEIHVNNAP